MIVVLYTNCQGLFLYETYLKNHPFFQEATYFHIENYASDLTTSQIDQLEAADILIYQPVTKPGPMNTVDKKGVLQYVAPTCKKICFPSLYAEIWPLYEEGGKIVGGDTINKYKHLTVEQIITLLYRGEYDFELQRRYQRSHEHMKEREEKYCDIKVADFIHKYIFQTKLFDSQNHPNGIVCCYVAKRICEILQIEQIQINEFTQGDISIPGEPYPDSAYMVRELLLPYVINDDLERLRYFLSVVYHDPEAIKYK